MPWELPVYWSKWMRYQFLNQSETWLQFVSFLKGGVKSTHLENWFWLVTKMQISSNQPIRNAVRMAADRRALRSCIQNSPDDNLCWHRSKYFYQICLSGNLSLTMAPTLCNCERSVYKQKANNNQNNTFFANNCCFSSICYEITMLKFYRNK